MTYYIIRQGKKLYHATMPGIQRLATEEANRVGRAITVYEDDLGIGEGGKRKAQVNRAGALHFERNPSRKKIPKLNTSLEIYNGGRADAKRGFKISDLPIGMTTDQKATWRKGWMKGNEEHKKTPRR